MSKRKLRPLMIAFYENYMAPKKIPISEVERVCKYFTKIDERAINFINNYKKIHE